MSADLRERPIRKGRSKRVTMAPRRRLLSRTPRAAAILVDEFDAGSFESLPHYNQRWVEWTVLLVTLRGCYLKPLTKSGSDRMTIKSVAKFCSLAAMVLVVFAALGCRSVRFTLQVSGGEPKNAILDTGDALGRGAPRDNFGFVS